MNKTMISIRLQVIAVYILITTAVLSALFSLGFMTNYYNLFMDGNDEMYNFFRSVQELNNSVFNWSLIFLVLSLLYLSFELHKGSAGLFGSVFALLTALYNGYMGFSLQAQSALYRSTYDSIDFSSLETYRDTVTPFVLTDAISLIICIASGVLALLCLFNYMTYTRKGVSHEA